jgi:transcriptional regulator with XRE-family HTH domain
VSEQESLGAFLRSRRARLSPDAPGPGRRQTPGLRRAEVAALAGVSLDYYIRLEQGRDRHPSASVVRSLATALWLDPDERAYLDRLVTDRPASTGPVRPGLYRLLASIRPTPGWLLDPTGTLICANPEGIRLLPGIEDWPRPRRNVIRYTFLHPASREVFVSWEAIARDCVADLRAADDGPARRALIADLSASGDFARLWPAYDVRVNRGGARIFEHPDLGRVNLTTEILTSAEGHRFVAFQRGRRGR